MRYQYQHIDAPDARYFKNGCYHTIGPESIAYYPFHGIFISIDLYATIHIGLHLPKGTTVALNGETVRIVAITDAGPIDTSIPIRASRHDYVRKDDPMEFGALDTFTSADNFGPLVGDTVNGHNLWYSFTSETTEPDSQIIRTPRGLIRGTVESPNITINGHTYESPPMPFERRVHTELAPVNC